MTPLLISETNRIQLVVFDAQNRTSGPYLAAINRILGPWKQDPTQADKLARIQSDLDETKVVLHKTIESMLDRGEKLENLVDKSSDLSLASQMFYKQARKTNSCCKMM
jgi:Synaptobrevin